MKKQFNILWPVGIIFIVWFLFASSFFLKGKVPFSATYQVNNFAPWDAYPQFAGPVKNGAMPDIITQIYPWKHFTIEEWKKGEIPLWNPYSFSGTPHLANYQSAVLSPVNLLFFIFPFITAWSISILLQPLLAGLFMYLYIRSLAVSKIGSVLGSISFMFCGFIVTWMDYGTLSYAILFLPLALFAIEKFSQSYKKRYLILLTTSIPLSFFSGHFQTSIYFFLFTAFYAIFTAFRMKNWELFFWFGLYIVCGILFSMPQILPSLEFYGQSVRSGLFQKVEVIPWTYIPTLFAPDFFGNPVTRNDWFGHYAEWNAYAGLVSLMVSAYSLRKCTKQILFFFISSVIILLLAFPSPFLDVMVALHIPVLSTSSASRIIVLFSFAVATLSGFGFDILQKDLREKRVKPLLVWIGIFFVIIMCLWLIVFKKLFFPLDKILIARQNILLPTLVFLAVTALIVFLFTISKMRKQNMSPVLSIVLVGLVAFDMLRFATKWQPFDVKQLVYPYVSVIEGFQKIEGYNRVLGNFGAETAVYYHLPSVEGYDPLYIRQYGQLVASMTDGKLQDSYRSAVSFIKNNYNTPQMINLLGITYIVHKKGDDFVGWTFPYWNYPGQYEKIFEDSAYRIYKNTQSLPHAFIASSYRVIPNNQQAITTLLSNTFNPKKEVILQKDLGVSLIASNTATAEIQKYSANSVVITASTQHASLLVLLDNIYPGWIATVDGKQTPILTADYSFRTIQLPEGTHTVVFTYRPQSFIVGLYLAIIGTVGVLAGFVLKKSTKTSAVLG